MEKLFLLLVQIVVIRGYSSGAPRDACTSMKPGHGFDPLNNDDTPVELILEPSIGSNIIPGQTVSFSLKSKNESTTFMGFLIQVRDDQDLPFGAFNFADRTSAKLRSCGNGRGNSLTHSNNEGKTGFDATWQAPEDYRGNATFIYTVALNYFEYYVKLQLEPLQVQVGR
eukprot:12633.XXX_673068_672503_1 [CDS] Oithona nana genome sequencing.